MDINHGLCGGRVCIECTPKRIVRRITRWLNRREGKQ